MILLLVLSFFVSVLLLLAARRTLGWWIGREGFPGQSTEECRLAGAAGLTEQERRILRDRAKEKLKQELTG